MLAYSTISHMGFVMIGILAGTDTGYGAAMFYVIVYALMTLGSFGMILLLSRAGFEAENLDDFRGLNQKSKWYAFVMLVLMFSLAGIPPAVGFIGKLFVLQAALDAGYTWLVVYAVLLSVIGAFYYLRIVKLMYMDAPVGRAHDRPAARHALDALGHRDRDTRPRVHARAAVEPLPARHRRRDVGPWRRSRPTSPPISARLRFPRSSFTRAHSSRCIATRCACPTEPRRGAST